MNQEYISIEEQFIADVLNSILSDLSPIEEEFLLESINQNLNT
tara:strand:+ start:1846 stop:1974 length:129 start_codon:yes stop_codon:yes gene_type:complete